MKPGLWSRSLNFGCWFHNHSLWDKRVTECRLPCVYVFFIVVCRSGLLKLFCKCPAIHQIYNLATPHLCCCNNTMFFSFHWTKSFWSRCQKLSMPGAGAWNLSSGSTSVVETHLLWSKICKLTRVLNSLRHLKISGRLPPNALETKKTGTSVITRCLLNFMSAKVMKHPHLT